LLGLSLGALCLIARVAVIEHDDSSLSDSAAIRVTARAARDAVPSVRILRSIPVCDGHVDLVLVLVRRSGLAESVLPPNVTLTVTHGWLIA
jgi:hypothetical protein